MPITRFLHRNRHPLAVLALLTVACVLVVHQFLTLRSAHVQLREDFFLLEHSEHKAEAAHLYQHMVQELTHLSLATLIDDWERATMVLGTNAPGGASLLAKYHTAVRRELEQRSNRRLPEAVKAARQ